jgi:pyruvate,water dikinase
MTVIEEYTQFFTDLTNDDTATVGGKNASLGEMISALKEEGVRVPEGFATTSKAYREFIEHNQLREKISGTLDDLKEDHSNIEEIGSKIREMIRGGEWPEEIAESIRAGYRRLCENYDQDTVPVAVRSSATAEDLPEASFAGQQETYLNVRGQDEVLEACKKCYASLFTNRAITYREEKGFDHMKIALSAGVQKMAQADRAGSGVMFTIDTETGFQNVVVINAAWGLGETVVGGEVNPDEYVVFKPLLDEESVTPIIARRCGRKQIKCVYRDEGGGIENVETTQEERDALVLDDDEILTLARWARDIENHYEKPMDIEWAKDADTGDLFIVQARPETVQSRKEAASLHTYELKEEGEVLATGLAIGGAIAKGEARILDSPDQADQFEEGDVLVTEMTDPDWGPIMNRASAIITNSGGRTAHAAIVSRELGIAAVVGAEGATEKIENGQEVTVSCARGEKGTVYKGALDFEENEVDLEDLPEPPVQIMMNIASPQAAFRRHQLPNKGVGLARMEFIINNIIKIHPMALIHFDGVEDEEDRERIEDLTRRYKDKTQYFVDHLAEGIARIAAAEHPHPVIVRMSDFKTNEYAGLIGGANFEPAEENPMLGFRGASRYYSDRYRDGFELECRAIRRVREEMGLSNVKIMIPFCRAIDEAERVLDVLKDNGLERGKEELEVYVMAEIPSNIKLAEQFAEHFDGFSIGSNDLTQLMLGVDRDSEDLSDLFDEQNEAVKEAIRELIEQAHKKDRKVGICGQAPSDYPEFAEFLVDAGIDSISLNPDSIISGLKAAARASK